MLPELAASVEEMGLPTRDTEATPVEKLVGHFALMVVPVTPKPAGVSALLAARHHSYAAAPAVPAPKPPAAV